VGGGAVITPQPNLLADAGCGAFDFMSPPPAGCDMNACVGLFSQGNAPSLIFTTTNGLSLSSGVTVSDDYFVFVAALPGPSAATHELAAIGAHGGAPIEVDVWSTGINHRVDATLWDGTSLVYLLTFQSNSGMPFQSSLRKWEPALGFATVLTANLPGKGVVGSTGGLARDSQGYLVVLDTGLWRVPKAGGTAQLVLPTATIITNLVTAGDEIYYSNGSGVFHLSPGGTPTLVSNQPASALTIVDGQLIILSAAGVQQLVGSTVVLRYAQQSFPQMPWLSRLAAGTNGKVYVGQICGTMDPDAPTYGTIELDLAQGAGRWISGSAGWPWATPVLDQYAAGVDPGRFRNASGFYRVGIW
jgi:hypothetical protein